MIRNSLRPTRRKIVFNTVNAQQLAPLDHRIERVQTPLKPHHQRLLYQQAPVAQRLIEIRAPFDVELGLLPSGDMIYVAVGGGAMDLRDTFALQYEITIPAPATYILLVFGLMGIVFTRRRY